MTLDEALSAVNIAGIRMEKEPGTALELLLRALKAGLPREEYDTALRLLRKLDAQLGSCQRKPVQCPRCPTMVGTLSSVYEGHETLWSARCRP